MCGFPLVVPLSGVRCSPAPFLVRGESNLAKEVMDGRDQTLRVLHLSPALLALLTGSADPWQGN